MSGSLLGSVTAFSISGWLVHTFNSWPLVFYFWGIVAAVWGGLALLYVFSYPSTHPFITEKELKFLQEVIRNLSAIKIAPVSIVKL